MLAAKIAKKCGNKAIKYAIHGSISFGFVLFVLFSVYLPSAHAGFFTVISSIFGKNVEEFSVDERNSQTIPLLQAPISPNMSVGGGDVTIVDESAIMPELDATGGIGADAHFSSGQISIYVVRKGDSLSQIAKMFGVSVNTIMWGNDLTSGTLSEGQTLVILPITGVQHKVKSGDTIESIAKKYKSDAEEIRQFNDLRADSKLAAGDVIIVPDGELATAPSKSQKVDVYSKTVAPTSYGAPKNPLPMRKVAQGYYINPLPGGRKTQGIHGYNGIDLAAPVGTPLLASAGGTVIVSKVSGWNGGYGIYVVIAHDNGTQTLYAHMSSIRVSAGMKVVQGQVIGTVGQTGKSTGPHVHFEIRGAANPF